MIHISPTAPTVVSHHKQQYKFVGTLPLDKYKSTPADTLMQSDFVARGWTRSIITKLLVGTVTYYATKRVKAAEASPECAAKMAKSAPRRIAAAKGVVTRIENMEER